MIKARELTKEYVLGGAATTSIRDALTALVKRKAVDRKILRALDGVSFEISEGETVGIIGGNGAGKSTLLKVLSRITKPTYGAAEIAGRVGSLLEVGTGFHNELSGRENIYLNGAILGMRRSEIDARFDEIVAFSEIEKFLDTPVKHYSSGMYMRLAFSIAAHLDPEVLIVDEVLAVGDMAFQKKCLGKMRTIGESGRTVLFVSHDMSAISRLCSRAIWLKSGKVAADGETREVLDAYLHEQSQTGAEHIWEKADRPGDDTAKLNSVRVTDRDGETTAIIDIRQRVYVEMEYEVLKDDKPLVPNLHFFNEQNVCIFVTHDWGSEWRHRARPRGTYTSRVEIPGNFLAEGSIYVGAALTTYQPLDVHFVEWDAVRFTVADSLDGDSARGDYAGTMPGIVRPVLHWDTEAAG